LDEPKTVQVDFTKRELEILVKAAGSASPNLEDEATQFKLYHKLLFKLNEFK
jgi:hypothetical protein